MASHIFARSLSVVSVLVLLLPCTAFADFDSGSDGSDGAFNPKFKTVIDLSLAATASWDTPSPVPGQGVYDPEKWAVVFKYTTIDISVGVTVSFTNHPSGAPVIWLASGDVMIAGEVNVNGADGANSSQPSSYAIPGPGGFAGGARSIGSPIPASGGFGPGGGNPGQCGAYSYGTVRIVPLIGGSGGGGASFGGGAGGGATLIASSTNIVISATGEIIANGGARGGSGAGGGSGGAIRLIADAVSGDGQLRAIGGSGCGSGRIRVDADVIDLSDLGNPAWTTDFTTFAVFPPDNEPILRITQIENEPIPADPTAGVPSTEVTIDTGNPVVVQIEAENVPSGTTVTVRVIPARGTPFSVTSTPLEVGEGGVFTATASVTFPTGKSEVHLKANWTP